MGKGFDCATPLSVKSVALFASQKYTFVGRYLAKVGSWKRLSPGEAKTISAAGIYIVSLFERDAGRPLTGAVGGKEDGKLALALTKEVGQPVGSAVYFCVDFDAQPKDFPAIEAYMRAAASELKGYELGIYGSYTVVEAMQARGVAKKFMQTYAWSRGKRSAHANIYQFDNGPAGQGQVINGVNVDLDESNGDGGGWKLKL